MSVTKVAGIETEYAVALQGDAQASAIIASRWLVGAYVRAGKLAVSCQSNHHIPASPAPAATEFGWRDMRASPTLAPEFQPFSYMLPNGARFYIDHEHPEYATPECRDPRAAIAADKAGELIVEECRRWANVRLGVTAQSLVIFKNNSVHKGTSYGCHENYLVSSPCFERFLDSDPRGITRHLLPYLITRVIWCGAGKVGAEHGREPTTYQLSQRADFFETLTGAQTMEHRPLFNTRDEPHADARRFRRLHVITGDANMAEYPAFLKIGVTQIILRMIEDDAIAADFTLDQPIEAIRLVSRDRTFRQPLPLAGGGHQTALDIQRHLLAIAHTYIASGHREPSDETVLSLWQEALDDIEHASPRLKRRFDWAIKLAILDRYLEAKRVTWDVVDAWQFIIEQTRHLDERTVQALALDPDHTLVTEGAQASGRDIRRHLMLRDLRWDDFARQREVYYGLRYMDLAYHAINMEPNSPTHGLYYRLAARGAIERLLTDEEVHAFVDHPPTDTRAWLRGQWIQRFPSHTINADWEELRVIHGEREMRLSLPIPYADTSDDWGAMWHDIERIIAPQRFTNIVASVADSAQEGMTNDNGTRAPTNSPAAQPGGATRPCPGPRSSPDTHEH